MVPVIALLGRPNVGKSTLFNRLTKTRDALVANFPGLTRDRQYGSAVLEGHSFIVIDTGGLSTEGEGLDDLMVQQSLQAADEADLLLFMVDAREGLNARDEEIAQQIRRLGKPVIPVINKVDSMDADIVSSEFHSLGLGEPRAIAAAHGRGVKALDKAILDHFPDLDKNPPVSEQGADKGMVVAVVGRPNVGKSTFINRLLGEERLISFDQPGTTRDSIFIPFKHDGKPVTLVDTAGVRRRSKVRQTVEKFSVIQTLKAVDESNVVIMMLDAREGIAEQDATVLGYVLEKGRALVLAINKWDKLEHSQRDLVRKQLELKLTFTDFAEKYFVSALHGSGVFDVLDAAVDAYDSAFRRFSTPMLNDLLQDMLTEHQPPMVKGRRIKLRYMHQGGVNPPRFIIHGNQVDSVPTSYQRFLVNRIQKQLHLSGTPVQINFRGGDNPFAGKRNKLTPRQFKRRERVRRHRGKK
ncbi:MAG: ribosome biogenesis GTPase Der [Gammaproteobacteria bacterium]|nr:MAG: ribosome biogenesis GTPase Der [Gammaproteobacteria bacterium]